MSMNNDHASFIPEPGNHVIEYVRDFSVGDVVQLKSGGPPMTVVKTPMPDEITVHYFDGSRMTKAAYDPVCLKPYESPPLPERIWRYQIGNEQARLMAEDAARHDPQHRHLIVPVHGPVRDPLQPEAKEFAKMVRDMVEKMKIDRSTLTVHPSGEYQVQPFDNTIQCTEAGLDKANETEVRYVCCKCRRVLSAAELELSAERHRENELVSEGFSTFDWPIVCAGCAAGQLSETNKSSERWEEVRPLDHPNGGKSILRDESGNAKIVSYCHPMKDWDYEPPEEPPASEGDALMEFFKQ